MKLLARILFATIITTTAHLHAIIFESASITDLLPHTQPETLVVFDLDDTTFRTASMLGNDAWFNYQVSAGMQQGFSAETAVQHILPLYLVIQYFAQLELIDHNFPALLKTLANNNIHSMSLTTRSMGLVERTKQELTRLGVSFAQNAPCDHDLALGLTHTACYTNGIIFGANNNKGKILLQFLDTIGYQPKKIIFVDDKRSHLESLERAIEYRGIRFVGLRYSAEDERKTQFDPILADKLLEEFKIKLAILPLS